MKHGYKLIVEENFSELEYGTELNEATGEKKYVIKGIFSTPEMRNRNGRIYPMGIWESNVREYNEKIKQDPTQALMELEHPPRSTIDKWNAVAKIRKLELRDGKVYGEAVILNNGSKETNQIKALIDEGVKIGVSSRGVGKLGKGNIVEDFKLITYDIVSTPSDYNANLEGFNESLILESKDFGITDDGKIVCDETGCHLKESIKKESKAEKLIETFKKFYEEPPKKTKAEMIAEELFEEYRKMDEGTASGDVAGGFDKLLFKSGIESDGKRMTIHDLPKGIKIYDDGYNKPKVFNQDTGMINVPFTYKGMNFQANWKIKGCKGVDLEIYDRNWTLLTVYDIKGIKDCSTKSVFNALKKYIDKNINL